MDERTLGKGPGGYKDGETVAKEIKQKIVLEGEQKYNAALKEAQRNLKTLRSELKAETAEMGKNASEQQKAEAKTKSLKAQIAEQEKVVQTLREALEEVREKYGDNADEVAKWELRLNNARTTLGNMRSQLEDVGSGFSTVSTEAAAATVAAKSVADSLEGIGSVGGSVSSAIENVFSSLIDRAAAMVESLWDMMSETAEAADNWGDLADYYNSSAQEIQMWDKAITAAGGDFNGFLAIVNKLAFGGKETDITNALGISKENYQDDIEYALAVLDELEKKKEKLTQNEMNGLLADIFGEKKATNVDWFLSAAHDPETGLGWRDNPERWSGGEGGTFGLSDDELDTMAELWVRINNVDAAWDSIKKKISAGFGTVALDLIVNVQGTLEGIADYLNAKDDGERQEALEKIRKNVEDFFRKLADVIREAIGILRDVGGELQESDDPLVSAIGDILVKLAEALQWMVDNQEQVKGALEAIFGVWLIGKLLAVAGQLGGIIMQIEAIQAFKGFGAISGAAAAEAGATMGGSWALAFWTAAMKAAPGLAFLYTLLKPAGSATDDVDTLFDAQTGTLTSAGWADYMRGSGDSVVGTSSQNPLLWDAMEEVGGLFGDMGRIAGDDSAVTAIARYAMGWNGYSQEDLIKDLQALGYTLLPEDEAGGFENAHEGTKAGEDAIYKDRRRSAHPRDWGGTVEEYEDLDAGRFTEADMDAAVQDWWDAWREAALGDGDYADANSGVDWMAEVFGDRFDDVWAEIERRLDETDDKMSLEDLPSDWWRTTGSWGATDSENGVTSADLEGFRGLPASMESAVQRGAARGISGIQVTIDGYAAGRILAPYVSQEIARSMVQ